VGGNQRGPASRVNSIGIVPAADSQGWLLPWGRAFRDQEDFAALHRFAWLLPQVLAWNRDGISENAGWSCFKGLAVDWIRNVPRNDSAAWHPYTLAERMVNWTFAAFAFGRDLRSEPLIWDSVREQVEYLRWNLEYYGEILTGNHLTNNGRALYLCGLAYRQPLWAAEGRAILLNESARLFPEGSFLREGSSHYQLLVTRNYSEILWAARTAKDHEVEDSLRPVVARLAAGCRFFLIQTPDGGWQIPLIGDISPDCAPEWLLGVPWMAAAFSGVEPPPGKAPLRGWHELFEPCAEATTRTGGPALEPSDWRRFESHGWTVFAHVNPAGFPLCPGHAHQDTGGFVAFHRGREIVIDAGRRSYLDDVAGRWGTSCRAHSLLSVDGLDPGPRWRRIYSHKFIARRAGSRPALSTRQDGIEVAHGGFARSRGVIGHRRRVCVQDGETMHVNDRVDGSGIHRVDLIFHFAGRPKVAPECIQLAGDGWRGRLSLPKELGIVSVHQAPAESDTFGWRSTRYGDKSPSGCVIARGEVSLPWEGTSQVSIEG